MGLWRSVYVTFFSLILGGCQSVGYMAHLGKGQWQMLSHRHSIDNVLHNPDTPETTVRKLESLQNIRQFAAGLGLPAKGQFDTYVDIHRRYAMWSVQATPELSLQARSWCYWFVGCLSFRNYFDETMADDFAAGLRQQGYDTHIGKVAAYSTLGWFRDSILSSQLDKSEADLAELVFHELAHQVVYAKGDPVFNESFAEVVAHESLRRFLVGRPTELQSVLLRLERQHRFAELVQEYRRELQRLYASSLSPDEKRAGKQRIFNTLKEAYQRLKQESWHGYNGYDTWFDGVNNARMNSVSVYHDLVPALDALLASTGNDLPAFFNRCRELAKLPQSQRHAILGYSHFQVELIHD